LQKKAFFKRRICRIHFNSHKWDDLYIVNDFLEKSRPIGLSVTTILQLQAGDRVQVLFSADANGEILAEAFLTNFQAARFPSPM